MNSLCVSNFKAFKETFLLSLDGKSSLIYGENGSGKTSLFEAVKLFFFKERILKELIPSNMVGEERDNEVERVFSEYKREADSKMVIEVDEKDGNGYNINDVSVFLVAYSNLDKLDSINLEEMVNEAYFSKADKFINWYSKEFGELVVDQVNSDLKDYFMLSEVEQHLMDNRNCTIKNEMNAIPKAKDLHRFFNESILHLVKFVTIIETITYFSEKGEKALIVLDDCFNSLDTPNRTFLMRFFLEKTKEIQKIVLTHNTGFYNLFDYIINNVENEKNKWVNYQLCKIDGVRTLLDTATKTINDIKANTSIENLGNELRKHFEILVYKLSRLVNIGELQEASTLLDKLCSPNYSVYLSKDGDNVKDIYTLLKEIESLANLGGFNLAYKIKKKIEKFRNNDFLKELQPILVELRLMQKVALHQTSHGHSGIPPISEKEIDAACVLLEKLEKALKAVSKRVDVSSV